MNFNDIKKKIQGNARAAGIISQAAKMYDGTSKSLKAAAAWADKSIKTIMPDLAQVVLTAVVVLLIVQMLGLVVLTVKTVIAVLLPMAGIVITAYVVHELTGMLLSKVNKAELEPAASPA